MANGVVLNPGVGGETVATDNVAGSGHVQLIKMVLSGPGSVAATLQGDNTYGAKAQVTKGPKVATVGAGGGSPQTIPVGTAGPGTVVLAANASRQEAEILNISDVDMFLAFDQGSGVNANAGNFHTKLKAGRGWYSDIYTGEIRAFHAADVSKQLAVYEL